MAAKRPFAKGLTGAPPVDGSGRFAEPRWAGDAGRRLNERLTEGGETMQKRMNRAGAVLLAVLAFGASAGEVPLKDCSGLPCASFDLGEGKVVTLLIDTGNDHPVLDLERAHALGLALEPYVSHSGKTVPGFYRATLPDLRLGGDSLGPAEWIVTDLKKDIAEGSLPASDGTVSYVNFKDRIVTLDYRRRRLSVSAPGAEVAAPAGSGALTYPTFGRKGPPIVVADGFQVDGKALSVQIDTLYSGTMLIYSTAIDRLALAAEAASPKKRRFPFTDGGVDMIEGRAAAEGFAGRTLLAAAPLYFATAEVHQPDGLFDGTVGAELFAAHRLTLDFHANKVWLD
jgi:hypothetical protein